MIEVRLDGQEILEHVDDMLSWEAIASEKSDRGNLEYDWSHFLRAEPLLRIGGGQLARLTPKSIVAEDDDGLSREARHAHRRDTYEWYKTVLPAMLEHPRYSYIRVARLIEKNVADEVPAGISGVDCPFLTGDDVRDLVGPESAGWTGVTYELTSIGELTPAARAPTVKHYRLPQTARLFLNQFVFAFADGRSVCSKYWMGYWNRRFFDLSKRPVEVAMADGFRFHPSIEAIGLALETHLEREDLWDVELSFGAKRTGVALQTDAVGARDIVNRLRRSDTSAGRRKAIVHWVNDHMRRRRKADNTEADIEVRGHLRGLKGLVAGRYFARIYPAKNLTNRATNGMRYE